MKGIKVPKTLMLRHRLIALFMVMAALVAITGAYGIWDINRVSGRVQEMLQNLANQQKIVLLMEMDQKVCQINLLQASMVRNDLDEFNDNAEDYRTKRDLFRNYCDILLKGNVKLGVKPAEKGSAIEEKTKVVLASWTEFEAAGDKLLERKEQLLKGTKKGVVDARAKDALADDELNRLSQQVISETNEKVKADVDDLLVAVGTQMTNAKKQVYEIQRSAGITFVVFILIATLTAAILGARSSRTIIRRIDRIGEAMDRGADGDLTASVAVDIHDEIGKLSHAFNSMIERLSEMVAKVGRSSVELTAISRSISDTSSKMINAAEVQSSGVNGTSSAVASINDSIRGVADGMDRLSLSASESSSSILEMAASVEEVALNVESLSVAVEEVSSSIMEMMASVKQIDANIAMLTDASSTTASSIVMMDASIKQVQSNAIETARISEGVLHDAEEGKASVEATIAGMDEIRRSSGITSDVIGNLTRRANDIGLILSVIDDVAEQTNLLALNAAIIAAQAGDHGKGFAVVAGEIKELAERTSSSTREISVLIKGVQEETDRAVDAISQAEKSIIAGEELSRNSGDALAKILSGMRMATSQVNEIAQATVEQANGSQMIRTAMDQVSEMVGQIGRATREQGKGSELIMTAVERMKGLTAQVRTSTREQSKAGNFISRSTEGISQMVQGIKGECDDQKANSEQIVAAVDGIKDSTRVNLGAARVLDESVMRLSKQIGDLQAEMESFRTTQKESPPQMH